MRIVFTQAREIVDPEVGDCDQEVIDPSTLCSFKQVRAIAEGRNPKREDEILDFNANRLEGATFWRVAGPLGHAEIFTCSK